ncbi:MAG: PAS domain S-box protein [Euryarchaeota archaeon]|nr:PAS domain S-box protein [Euryarchaeota archaeon]
MISLLYVDDEPALLDITKIFLEKHGEFRVDTVKSAPEAMQKLQAVSYDAIVSDYEMPEMNGIDFLKEIRSGGNEIPFIIFTGKGREDVVIEALNSGADFYIQKGGEAKSQFAELTHKIRQAVETKRAEEELIRSETLYKTIFEFTSSPTAILNEDTSFVKVNSKMADLLGHSKKDIESKIKWTEFIVKEDLSRMVKYHQTRRDDPGSVPKNYEFRLQDGKGNLRNMYLTAGMIPGTKMSVISLLDITSLKQNEEELQAAYEQMQAAFEEAKASEEMLMRQNRELEESEKKFRTLAISIPVAVMIYQNDRWIYANPAAEKITGYTEKELLDTTIWEFTHPDCRDLMTEMGKLRKTGFADIRHYQVKCITKTGEEKWMDLAGGSIEYHGSPAGIITADDITKLKLAEKKISRSEVLYRTVFENTGTAMAIIDKKGIITLANHEMENISGCFRNELEGRIKITRFIAEYDLSRMKKYHLQRRVDPESVPDRYEFTFINSEGDAIPALINIEEIPGTENSVCSIINISERKKTMEALTESKNKLVSLLVSLIEGIPDPICMKNVNGRHLLVNKAFRNSVGLKYTEIRGKTNKELLPPDLAERYDVSDEMVMSKGEIVRDKYQITDVNGKDVFYDTIKIPLFDNKGNVKGLIGISRDITEMHIFHDALKDANKKLNLLSDITRHDILNQITGLSGYTELLEEILPDDPDMQKYISAIGGMTELIAEKISFTRDYQDMGIKNPEWQDVYEVVRSKASLLPAFLPPNGITLDIETGSLEVLADPMLGKVFFNLLDNAIRHGGDVTEIWVSFHKRDGKVVLVFEDNGDGVSEDIKEHIFDQGFGRGSGLGLFLVKDILDITGISISETGGEGKGARFEIVVPAGYYRT